MMRKIIVALLFLVSCALQLTAQMSKDYVPCNSMPNIMQNYDADVNALNRVYIVEGSPEKRERYQQLAADYVVKLNKLDFAGLTQGCRADYILFKRDLEETIRTLKKEADEYNGLKQWFPFADSVYAIEKIRRRGGLLDGKNVANTFNTITKQLQQLQLKLVTEKTITVSNSREASIIIGGLQTAAKNVFDFYNGYDPLFTWWVPMTYKKMDSALTVYNHSFHTVAEMNAPHKDSSGIVGFPVGRAEILSQLQYELISYTPEELIEIANKEFAWCDKEMLKASAEMGFGSDWKKALEKVKQSYVPVGEQAAAMMKL
jgi:hypothetical protein